MTKRNARRRIGLVEAKTQLEDDLAQSKVVSWDWGVTQSRQRAGDI